MRRGAAGRRKEWATLDEALAGLVGITLEKDGLYRKNKMEFIMQVDRIMKKRRDHFELLFLVVWRCITYYDDGCQGKTINI